MQTALSILASSEAVRGGLNDHLQLFGVALVASLTASLIAYLGGFYRVRQVEPAEKPKLSLKAVLGAFLIFLGVTGVFPAVALILKASLADSTPQDIESLLSNQSLPDFARSEASTPNWVFQAWTNLASIYITLIALIIYLAILSLESRKAVIGNPFFEHNKGESLRRDFKDIAMGCVTWFVCYPLVLAAGQAFSIATLYFFAEQPSEQLAVRTLRMTMNYPFLLNAMVVSIIFAVPVIEELLFRGFLQTWLKRILGTKWAIATASLIFALFHYSPSQGGSNLEVIGTLFVFSLFLGFIYERQRSILSSIALHSFFNAVSIVIILTQQ